MKRNLNLLLMWFILLLLMANCTSKPTTVSDSAEEKFQAKFPNVPMNIDFSLELVSDAPKLGPDSEIRLSITNKSPQPIYFPLDSYVRIFVLSHSEWVEVKNQIIYSGLLQLSPQGTPLKDSRITRVQPVIGNELLDNEKKNQLRIVVVGEIMEGDTHTGKFVGAYVDIPITP